MIRRLLAAWLAGLIGATSAGTTGAAEAPSRVVSMNVCTDQLAMLVAGAGQLHSVSYLAADPATSVLAERAKGYVLNHGLAEEVFLMQPDLVLAGTYSTRATVGLLRTLGIRVEEFEPEASFDDVRRNMRRMGAVLGREDRARELVAELDGKLAALAGLPATGSTVAAWYANSYIAGAGTLVDAVIEASGLTNIAARMGFAGTARLPLEALILAQPDMLMSTDRPAGDPGLAYEGFVHPAFRVLAAKAARVDVPTAYTVCGAPFPADAAALLRETVDGHNRP